MLSLLVALPFVASAFAAVLPTHARNLASTWAASTTLVGLVLTATLFADVQTNAVLRQSFAWLDIAGVGFVIRVDGFAWLFAMLIYAIGLLVVVYARYYMAPADPVPRFFSFLLAFMGSMLGIVLSGNLVQIMLFWELASLFSFLLIGSRRCLRRRSTRGSACAGTPLASKNVVRGQFRGYRDEPGVAANSNVETFAALQLEIDSWRWQGVPFFIRAGKCLPVTSTEVVVRLRHPPKIFQHVSAPANYVRFRIGPDVAIAIGATVMDVAESMIGQHVELLASQHPAAARWMRTNAFSAMR